MENKPFLLPIEPYLKKWLIHFRKYKDGNLRITSDFVFSKSNNTKSIYIHYSKEGMETIKVYMRHPNKWKGYYLHRHLKCMFDYDLLNYAIISNKIDIPVMPAIEEFLAKCRITENELKLETAYKRWQRASDASLPNIKPAQYA